MAVRGSSGFISDANNVGVEGKWQVVVMVDKLIEEFKYLIPRLIVTSYKSTTAVHALRLRHPSAGGGGGGGTIPELSATPSPSP